MTAFELGHERGSYGQRASRLGEQAEDGSHEEGSDRLWLVVGFQGGGSLAG